MSLHARRTQAVARGVGSVISSYVDHASGGTLVDTDGREWIDFASGIAVTSVGNSAPLVVEAVKAQVDRFTHTCFMVAPYESYVTVCEELNALHPGDFEKRSRCSTRARRRSRTPSRSRVTHTRRQAVVVFDHGYHGVPTSRWR
jgi:4-aminobutyrate aminotransferase/(S)-3-amino-2-methylpropionate transaminase